MIVIDASVACKWVFEGEENREKAFLLLKKHLEEFVKLIKDI